MEQLAGKKKAILDTTLELIREHGFHGTPMSLVAKKAGVAAGTIYHYFESKDALICNVFSYIMTNAIEAMQQNDSESLPYKYRFYNLWLNLYRFYSHNPNVLIFFEQFVNSPYQKLMHDTKQDKIRQHLNLFMAQGVRDGFLREANPEVLSVLVLGNIITTAKMMRLRHVSITEQELLQIREIIWDGMTKRS
ncbi:TetR/AcrR family transcriptional regulator [Pontibacter akesuensis]|uniref:Transcriptional regulator, TetR family n=1 Tax=Pontibacter akesuensis TaxID=388950 RepID=A0A1I7G1S1_9BACT|nr:TetR/AcrR family transcriptional regulator [Pontibacter akesuensis]GHA59296.1 TetR family transcriptional regulator [Pontibacter akesuensis]SFU42404.1 transcriptional regulator, TetR family [Pontibacter akesuensis]